MVTNRGYNRSISPLSCGLQQSAKLKGAPRGLRGALFRNWQYLALRAVAKKAYTSLRIHVLYDCNVNVVYYDGIQLFKEEFGHSYL